MLKKTYPGEVVSDEGFSLRNGGRELAIYEESGKELRLDCYYDPEKKEFSIHAFNIPCWSKPDGEVISPPEREKIISRIKAAVLLFDEDFVVVTEESEAV